MSGAGSQADLDRFYTDGDVYDALDACSALQTRLARLKRQHILAEQEWRQSEQQLSIIRTQLEEHLTCVSKAS